MNFIFPQASKFLLFQCVKNQINTLVYTEPARIKANIVIYRVAPLAIGIMLIIHFSFLILIRKALLRLFLAFTVKLNYALGAAVNIRMDKGMESVLAVFEYKIGASAHYYAGLLGKL